MGLTLKVIQSGGKKLGEAAQLALRHAFFRGRASSDGEGHLGVSGNCQEALPGAT